VGLAARGSRNLDSGDEKIEDGSLVTKLHGQARKVHIESVLAAILLTAIALVLF
jgi:hypothetical protein